MEDVHSNSVGTFKTGNTEWTVRVQNRRFTASAPGFNDVSGDTWEAMENNAKVQASKAKIKVAVPYLQLRWAGIGQARRPEFERKTATGIHSANGNVLYTDGATGNPGQKTDHSTVYRPFSEEDEAVYLRREAEIRELRDQQMELEGKYAMKTRNGHSGLKYVVQEVIDDEHAKREGRCPECHMTGPHKMDCSRRGGESA